MAGAKALVSAHLELDVGPAPNLHDCYTMGQGADSDMGWFRITAHSWMLSHGIRAVLSNQREQEGTPEGVSWDLQACPKKSCSFHPGLLEPTHPETTPRGATCKRFINRLG